VFLLVCFFSLGLCVKKNVSRKGAKGFWGCVFGGVFFFAALREKKCVTQRRKGAKGF